MSRSGIVDDVFSRLTSRDDSGLGQFRAILKTLLEWERFDSYYFDKLKKLDRATAEKNLAHLKQLQEIRDSKIKSERASRERRAAMTAQESVDLPSLLTDYLELYQGILKPQKRGYRLEYILSQLAKHDKLEVTESFKIVGEQIDGTVKYDGEHYLLEAKWQDTLASNEPLYQLASKVEGKLYGRGLFVSINGFSRDAVHALTQGKALKTILVDGEDIILVLEQHISFKQMLDKKIKAAQTKGQIYIHPISKKLKVA